MRQNTILFIFFAIFILLGAWLSSAHARADKVDKRLADSTEVLKVARLENARLRRQNALLSDPAYQVRAILANDTAKTIWLQAQQKRRTGSEKAKKQVARYPED